jgi:phosphatidylinositol alpha-mannosyltransferase
VKLAFLHIDLPPTGEGGVAYQVDLLASEMAKRHDLTVFTAVGDAMERPYKTVVCRRPDIGPATKPFGAGLAFARLRLGGFDVVHAHGDSWGVRHRALVRTFYGTALAEARSATSVKRCLNQTVRYGLELVSCLRRTTSVAIAPHVTRYLPHISRVVPCAVDPQLYYPGDQRFAEPTVLLVAGRLGGRKRGHLALQAFEAARSAVPSARMIIVSRDRIEASGVESRAAISDVSLAELFRRSWVLCSASSYEGFGLPYAQAMMAGLPVVTTFNQGAIDVLGETYEGVVPDKKLSEALLAAMKAGPADANLLMLERARRFDLRVVADSLDDVYLEALAAADR